MLSRYISRLPRANSLVLKMWVDGSILEKRKHVNVNSETLIKSLKQMGITVDPKDLSPGKGLVIKIINC